MVRYLRQNYKENLRQHIIKSRSIWFYIMYKREYWKSIKRRGGPDLKRRKWVRGLFTTLSNVMAPTMEERAKVKLIGFYFYLKPLFEIDILRKRLMGHYRSVLHL